MTALRKAPTKQNSGDRIGEAPYAVAINAELTQLWLASAQFLDTVAGTANAITANCGPAPILAYNKNQSFWLIPPNTNTAPVVVNIDGKGNRNLVDGNGVALVGGALRANGLYLLVDDGAQLRVAMGGGGSAGTFNSTAPDLIVQDQKASATIGAPITGGIWNIRELNTVVRNVLAGAALASNTFTLQAGTYYIEFEAPGYQCSQHQSRLMNITDNAVICYGGSENNWTSAINVVTRSNGYGVFTISSAKQFQVQHKPSVSGSGGSAAASGGIEIYATARVWKVGALPTDVVGIAGGVISRQYTFDSSTVVSDPGPGVLRLSSATQNASAAFTIDILDATLTDMSAVFDAVMPTSTSITKGQILLCVKNDPTRFIMFDYTTTGAAVGYRTLAVSAVHWSAASPFVNGDILMFNFQRTGDAGAGAGIVSPRISTANRTGITGAARPTLTSEIVNMVSTNNGGHYKLPAGIFDISGGEWLIDLSAITTRMNGRFVIEGEGVATVIRTINANGIRILCAPTNSEAYIELRNMKIVGSLSAGGIGLSLNAMAYFDLVNVIIEGFDFGLITHDVEQFTANGCNTRFCNAGASFDGVATVTDTNSVVLINCAFANCNIYGVLCIHANAYTMIGGSIQYCGYIGGPSTTGGEFFQEAGTGYATVNHLGVVYEGNGGMGDFNSAQTTNPGNYTWTSCAWARTFITNTTISGAANNGSGLIRLTVASSALLATGNTVGINSVLGTTEANNEWTITVIDPTHIDLQGSAFVHAYTSGGLIARVGYGTNNVNVNGTNADSVYNFIGNTFRGYSPYVFSAFRPVIALNNPNCQILDIGNYIPSLVERTTFLTGQSSIRDKLRANRTYFVSPTGNDSNNGLTAGSAFLTGQRAINVVSALDISTFNVTIQFAAGTYTGSIVANGPWLGSGIVTLLGDTFTPSNCLIAVSTASTSAIVCQNGATLTVNGFKITCTGAGAVASIKATSNSMITVGVLDFGASNRQVQAGVASTVLFPGGGGYNITGSANTHWFASSGGAIVAEGVSIFLSGTPAFSNAFCDSSNNGTCFVDGNTFTGSGATGKRYNTDSGIIFTGAAGATYLPGNVAGTAVNGGQYK